MWINNLDPVLLEIGGLEIRWYGLVYALGFLLTGAWLSWVRKKGKLNLSKDEVGDYILYIMIGGILGARLFEAFWQPNYYLLNPLNFLKIWEGGMSFQGGLVGGIAATLMFCRKKGIKFFEMADVVSLPFLLFLALGRLANFINGELIGKQFSGRWCVIFPNYDNLCRHPYVLYEAGKRFILLGWLSILYFKEKFKEGFIFWNFIFFEGLGRFVLDFYKEDIFYLFFTPGQWMSLVMIVAAGYALMRGHREDWKRIF